jgi:pimeloyl-ACP methyl ester carboxylesterase
MSTWVFLRGLTRDKRHWGDFPSVFKRYMTDANVVCVDLRGNGELHCMDSATRIEDMLSQCRETLAARGYAPPYRVLALSMGAMIATAWCEHYPEEVQGCVLINTSLRALNPFYLRLRAGAWLELLRFIYASMNPYEQEKIIFHLTSSHGDFQNLYASRWANYREQYPVSMLNAMRQLLAAARYYPSRARPQIPLLLLAAAKDRLVHPDCSRQLAEIWQAPLHVHPTAGHDLPLDDGLWIARKVRAWLDTQS